MNRLDLRNTMVDSVLTESREKPVNRPVKVRKPVNLELFQIPLMYICSGPPRPQEHGGRLGLDRKPTETS